jgi:hypothetical protein
MIKDGLVESAWEPWYEHYCKSQGITECDLMHALECFYRFMVFSHTPEIGWTMADALRESGFLSCPQAAQLVVVAKAGQLTCGAWWYGARELVRDNEAPSTIRKMGEWAEQTRQLLSSLWNVQIKQHEAVADKAQMVG